MTIFIKAVYEPVVAVGDKFRIDLSGSYKTPDEDALTEYIIDESDVSTDKFLDMEFYSEGEKSIVVSVNGTEKTLTILCLSEEEDALFSSDEDLKAYEPDVLKYLFDGKFSFKNIHRMAQTRILDHLDERKIWSNDGTRITKEQILNITEVNRWSTMLVLQLIFDGVSNAVDDVFDKKARKYEVEAIKASNRSAIRLDFNKNSTQDSSEIVNQMTISMVR